MVAKALGGQRIVVEGGSRAAAPKRSMTYAFTQGNFLLHPIPNLQAHISASRPKSLKTGIWASKMRFQP